jgi:hypothetical protein
MILINKNATRFNAKIGSLKKEQFDQLLVEIRKIEKRFLEWDTKVWSFPNAALHGFCDWLDNNQIKYELRDPKADMMIHRYDNDKIAVELSNDNADFEQLKVISCESIIISSTRTMLLFNNHNVHDWLSTKFADPEYKYQMTCQQPSAIQSTVEISPKKEASNSIQQANGKFKKFRK